MANLNLLSGSSLNLAGALIFAQTPQFRLPACIVKAVAFPGTSITDERYLDSRDIAGKLADVYREAMAFIRNPILASFAAKLLPYRGLGSGILRALRAYPRIEFIEDRPGNLFKAIVARPKPSS